MSAVDILTPSTDPAVVAKRNTCTSALGTFNAAIGTNTTDIDTAAQALLAAVEAAPAGRLREMARERVVDAAAAAHLSLSLGGSMPGIPGADLAASLAVLGVLSATRALNGGAV